MGNDSKRAKKKNLSRAYADPAIAAKQRELVDRQLADMRAGNAPSHFRVIGDVLDHIKWKSGPGSLNLLDVGCGSAYYSEIIDYFTPGLIEYSGCDYNPGMVDLVRERYPELPIFQADARDLQDFAPEQFDIVLSGALIIHVREWRAVLKELARVTSKWLVLHRTWVHTDATPTIREKRDAYGQQVWYYTFNEEALIEIVRKLGFELMGDYNTGESIQRGAVKTYLFRRLEEV